MFRGNIRKKKILVVFNMKYKSFSKVVGVGFGVVCFFPKSGKMFFL